MEGLPKDILRLLIERYLPPLDAARFRLTCRRMYALVTDKEFEYLCCNMNLPQVQVARQEARNKLAETKASISTKLHSWIKFCADCELQIGTHQCPLWRKECYKCKRAVLHYLFHCWNESFFKCHVCGERKRREHFQLLGTLCLVCTPPVCSSYCVNCSERVLCGEEHMCSYFRAEMLRRRGEDMSSSSIEELNHQSCLIADIGPVFLLSHSNDGPRGFRETDYLQVYTRYKPYTLIMERKSVKHAFTIVAPEFEDKVCRTCQSISCIRVCFGVPGYCSLKCLSNKKH